MGMPAPLFLFVLASIAGASADDLSWVESLKQKGYLVREGLFDYFTTETCVHTDTCYAVNPITPYGLIYLPKHDNETSDGNYTNTCHTHKMCKEHNGETYAPTWRVAPGEAIVMVGRTPPESTYWSLAPSLYSRFNDAGFQPHPKDLNSRIVACKKGPSRCEVFSAVNDPLNFQTVNTSDGNPFNSSVAIVLSWDGEVQTEVTGELTAAKTGPVNNLQYPGAIGKLGVTKGTEDEYIMVARVEGIKRKEDAEKFYGSAPYRVFRVSRQLDKPPAATSAHASFEGRMRTRWTGKNESAPDVTNEQLRDGLLKLKKLVIKENTRLLDYTSVDFGAFVNDSGYECLAQGVQCQGDCRDTIYAKATLIIQETLCNMTHLPCKPSRHSELTAQTDDAYYVMGVNHKMTNQSAYSSMTFYNYPKLAAGIVKTKDGHIQYSMMDTDYKGSAEHILQGHPAAPYLYLIKYARKCAADETVLCVEVPAKTTSANETAMGLHDEFVFIERMYIHPGTKSGPAVSETVLPVLLHVKPRFAEQIIV